MKSAHYTDTHKENIMSKQFNPEQYTEVMKNMMPQFKTVSTISLPSVA